MSVAQYADNKELQAEWVAAKKARKLKLTAYLKKETGYTVNPDAMFDIQVTPPPLPPLPR